MQTLLMTFGKVSSFRGNLCSRGTQGAYCMHTAKFNKKRNLPRERESMQAKVERTHGNFEKPQVLVRANFIQKQKEGSRLTFMSFS